MSFLQKLLSLWFLRFAAAGLALYLAQLRPVPGIIIMMLGGPLIAGLLFHVALLSLFIEAVLSRVPRIFALLPIVAYGSYYVAYYREPAELAAKEARLKASLPVPILFDNGKYAYATKRPTLMVERLRVPAIYSSSDRPYVFLLVPAAECERLKGNSLHIYASDLKNSGKPGACRVSFPHSPNLPVMEIVHHPFDRTSRKDSEEITDITVDGQIQARYVALHTTRLPSWPTLIAGCFLSGQSPAWICKFDFFRQRLTLNGYPGAVGNPLDDIKLIGLKEYSTRPDAFIDFSGYPENAPLLKVIDDTVRDGKPLPF